MMSDRCTVWEYDGGLVGWITQLVVDVGYRKRYIATQLLQTLKLHPLFQDVTAVGLASSHPASCYALAKYSCVRVDSINTNFIRDNAKKILDAAPVGYLKSAELRGSLFQDDVKDGVISSVDTNFFVDHAEPLDVLGKFQSRGQWPLGALLDGHEFLVVVPVITGVGNHATS